MASNGNYNSNEIPVTKFNFTVPRYKTLKKVLETKLRQHFINVSIELVDCPDFTQEPFNLAAPGLSGKTAIIDLGGISNLPLEKKKVYVIEHIISKLDNNYISPFILGDSIVIDRTSSKLCELAMNASFSRAIDGRWEINNKSSALQLTPNEDECRTDVLTDCFPPCIERGTFFLCEGTPKPVLRIYVKEYRNWHRKSSTEFTSLLQNALYKKWGHDEKIVALGGVYTTKNVTWEHVLSPNYEFETEKFPRKSFCTVNLPTTRIGIFNSTELIHTSKYLIRMQTCETSRSLSHHSSAEFNCSRYDNTDIEYVGYFSPINTLYRIDEPIDKERLQNID